MYKYTYTYTICKYLHVYVTYSTAWGRCLRDPTPGTAAAAAHDGFKSLAQRLDVTILQEVSGCYESRWAGIYMHKGTNIQRERDIYIYTYLESVAQELAEAEKAPLICFV